jgi:hypothetical protein
MSAKASREPADSLGDQAELAGRLAGRVNALPRDEFGEEHALAVTAAYRRVEALIIEELRHLCEED